MTRFLLSAFFPVLITLMGCDKTPAQKPEPFTAESQKNLNQARIDSFRNFLNFKEAVEIRLSENDNKISELKKKMLNKKPEIRAKYQNQLDELDRKNAKLRIRIQRNQEWIDSQPDSFKLNFNLELFEVENSIASLSQSTF